MTHLVTQAVIASDVARRRVATNKLHSCSLTVNVLLAPVAEFDIKSSSVGLELQEDRDSSY